MMLCQHPVASHVCSSRSSSAHTDADLNFTASRKRRRQDTTTVEDSDIEASDCQTPLNTIPPVPSSDEALMRWLQEYEIRQVDRNSTIYMKLDRVERAMALISSQLAHNLHSDTDDEASQMPSGPSAQSLIERGVRDGYSLPGSP